MNYTKQNHNNISQQSFLIIKITQEIEVLRNVKANSQDTSPALHKEFFELHRFLFQGGLLVQIEYEWLQSSSALKPLSAEESDNR